MRQISVLVIVATAAALAAPVHAQGVTATFTTTSAGGGFSPKNVVAVWVEDSGGGFVKTIGRWANTRKADLVAWNLKAGANDVDAVSGATRPDHATPLSVTWDLKSKAGTVVPDATYTLRMELADSNTSTTTPNHEGTFTFVKGPSPQTQTGLSSNGFVTVSITYAASAACGNGVIDPGETCDPSSSCPTSCAPSGDVCNPVALVGSVTTCTAACVTQPITACTSGDGCCPAGCDVSSDTDCAPGGGGGGGATSGAVTGGCTVSERGGTVLVFALIALVTWRRPRRPSR